MIIDCLVVTGCTVVQEVVVESLGKQDVEMNLTIKCSESIAIEKFMCTEFGKLYMIIICPGMTLTDTPPVTLAHHL